MFQQTTTRNISEPDLVNQLLKWRINGFLEQKKSNISLDEDFSMIEPDSDKGIKPVVKKTFCKEIYSWSICEIINVS